MSPFNKQPLFYVGSVPVFGDLILAPMEGFSDLPFRSLCREMGSSMSYTAFINAIDVINNAPYLVRKTKYLPRERPVVFQLFDSDPDRLLAAALRLQELEPDIIDINLGCSVRRVSSRGAGAGLLRTPLKVARIFKMISSALQIPLTAKIRLGWDLDQRNYCLIARIVQENGGALVAVHGRTKSQGYGGQADWDAIAEIKSAVSIPVIGNGDVASVEDIDRLKAHTGCEAVMIGRAAVGNPWIFTRRERETVSPDEVVGMARRHLDRMIEFYGPEQGVILFRKHAKRYARADRLSPAARTRFLTAEDPDQMLNELNAVLH
ncbi:MAG: tRNA dihydrouridine synthase [Anaerolineales bacterium]|jgi:tRNA-dihydrouridine synthase B